MTNGPVAIRHAAHIIYDRFHARISRQRLLWQAAGALTPVMPPVCEELLRKPGLEETNDGRRIGPAGAGIAAGAPLFAVLPADP